MDNGFSDDIPSQYKEKKWGKTQDGEYIIDGFTFKGKGPFKKAKVGLAELMKKGSQDEVGGTRYRVLDTRIKGAGLEIEVEKIDHGSRGVAVLKLYGPSKTKEYNVMVNKSKESGHEFVSILAGKIVKPLMKKFLDKIEVSNAPVKKLVSIREKRMNSVKGKPHICSVCCKECKTSAGLKGHITRMHANNPNSSINTLSRKRKSKDDIIQVVEELLEEVIQISDDEVELEESIVIGDEEEEVPMKKDQAVKLKYVDACDYCGDEVSASKKYLSAQMIRKHKETCNTKTCKECDFIATDKQQLRRHRRDNHGVVSESTSPPKKKKKCPSNISPEEPMVIDTESMNYGEDVMMKRKKEEHDIKTESKFPPGDGDDSKSEENDGENFADLSSKLEDMEIDNDDSDTISLLEERSDNMDKKVKEREKKLRDEELIKEKNKKESEAKKKRENKLKMEIHKKEKKQKKQRIKDAKKKKKKVSTAKVGMKDEVISNIPNIRNVPENCRHLVNKDDVLYLVPGDGCCGPNCAAAFLFKDEVYGPKLRREMNIFFADHWYERYQLITPCSGETPFVRKLGGGGEVSFTDPEMLIKYLKNSENAAYMWSDSEDLSIISDMYQIRIKVITTKGLMDERPTVNWIYPDVNLAKYAELKNVKLDDMTILHEDDMHFNLVISKETDLVRLGSLSYRFNIGPFLKKSDDVGDNDESNVENSTEVEQEDEGSQEEIIINLQKKLKESEVSKKTIEKEYMKCEKELRLKIVETEKLKTEIRDLKEIMNLKEKLEKQNNKSPPVDKEIRTGNVKNNVHKKDIP